MKLSLISIFALAASFRRVMADDGSAEVEDMFANESDLTNPELDTIGTYPSISMERLGLHLLGPDDYKTNLTNAEAVFLTDAIHYAYDKTEETEATGYEAVFMAFSGLGGAEETFSDDEVRRHLWESSSPYRMASDDLFLVDMGGHCRMCCSWDDDDYFFSGRQHKALKAKWEPLANQWITFMDRVFGNHYSDTYGQYYSHYGYGRALSSEESSGESNLEERALKKKGNDKKKKGKKEGKKKGKKKNAANLRQGGDKKPTPANIWEEKICDILKRSPFPRFHSLEKCVLTPRLIEDGGFGITSMAPTMEY